MDIFYSSRFQHEYSRLPLEIKNQAKKKENFFRKNPFDPRLKTHKLGGKLSEVWAFSVDNRYRIIFEFLKGGKIIFYAIGDHSLYNKL